MTKGEKTAERIIEAARKLFAERGYNKVTMADICKVAGISRGGLYAHFSSTAEILRKIIDAEQKNARRVLEEALERKISPVKIIKKFLSERAKDICLPSSINTAINEFARSDENGLAVARKRADDAINIISDIVSLGQMQGLFNDVNPYDYACGILWKIEGMYSHSSLFGLSIEEAERQLALSVDILLKK